MPGFGFGVGRGARRRGAAGAPLRPVIMAVLAGQSNMEGRQEREAQDVDVTGAAQYVGDPAQAYRTISTDITPLYGPYTTQDLGAAGSLGPGEYIARQLLADNPAASVVLVPTQRGSTYMIDGDRQWLSDATPGAGGILFENMIGQANAAYAAVQAAYPGRPIQVQLYWVQGEFDADGINNGHAGISRAAYRAALSDLVTRFRARVTGAANAPATIGSMVPERWDPASPNKSQGYIDINAAHVDVSVDLAGVRYARGPYYTQAEQDAGGLDFLHYKPARRVRVQGLGMAAALSDVSGPTMTSSAAVGTTAGARLALALACDDSHATFHLNGGADAARFEISDRYLAPKLRWVGDGTGPGAGGYAVRVRARDGSGNYGTDQAVTLTVASAYGTGDQGPVTATYLGNGLAAGTQSSSPVAIGVPVGVGLNLICFNSGGGAGDVDSVTAPGGTTGFAIVTATQVFGANNGVICTVFGLISATAGTVTLAAGISGQVADLSADVVLMAGTKATALTGIITGANANPPWTAPSVTVPANGMGILIGTTPSTTRTVSAGATMLSGATTGQGNRVYAAKRATTGSTDIDGGSGIYFVAEIAFEKSV